MKLVSLPILAFLAVAALSTSAVAQEKRTVAQLAFLTGSWRGTSSSGAAVEELISTPEGGVLLSTGREFRGGKCIFYDLVVIAEKEDAVILIPHPSGKRSPHVFPLVKLDVTAKRATFENKANDFPKAFTYELAEPDHLRITLSGDVEGKSAKEVYDLRRAK